MNLLNNKFLKSFICLMLVSILVVKFCSYFFPKEKLSKDQVTMKKSLEDQTDNEDENASDSGKNAPENIEKMSLECEVRHVLFHHQITSLYLHSLASEYVLRSVKEPAQTVPTPPPDTVSTYHSI